MSPKTLRKLKDITRSGHRYLAFAFGILWLLSAFTGSLIAYHDDIDALSNRSLFFSANGNYAPADGALFDFDRAEKRALATLGPGFSAYRIILPRQPGWNVRVQADDPNGTDQEVFLDPVTYDVAGIRQTDDHWIYWIYDLHRNLLAGDIGALFVGITGLFLILTVIGGLFMWWPQKKAWKFAFQLQLRKPWRRANWQLHRIIGAIVAPLLLIVAATGAAMIFPEEFDAGLAAILPLEDERDVDDVPLPTCNTSGHISLNEAVALSVAAYPDAIVKDVFPIYRGDDYLRVHVARPEDPRRISGGQTRVYFDATCGSLYHTRDLLGMKAGNTVNAWIFPLHNGEAFGEFGRKLSALVGVLLAVSIISGLAHYWLRRRKRKPVTSGG